MLKTRINTELLKNFRQEKGLSISDMAQSLNYRTPTGYWLVESNKRRISVDNLYKLSQVCNKPMEQLILITEN